MGPDRAAVKSHYRVLFELAIQRALADPEDFGRLAAVALGVAQRGLDRRALHVGHRHAGAVHHLAFLLARRLPLPLHLDRQRRGDARPGADLDHFDPLGALFQPAPQLLHLELELDEAAEDERQLLARDVAGRAGEPHRQPAAALADLARDVARADLPLGASTTIDSTRFRSWRMLPGQSASTRICSASGVMPRKLRSWVVANSAMKRRTRSGMSALRSRSGGR